MIVSPADRREFRSGDDLIELVRSLVGVFCRSCSLISLLIVAAVERRGDANEAEHLARLNKSKQSNNRHVSEYVRPILRS